MNDPFSEAGLTLGLVLVAAYTICCRRSGRVPDLAEAIRILFASLGTAAGTKVLTFVVDARQMTELADADRIYLFIGGFATVWVSFQAIKKSLKKAPTMSGI